MTFLTDNEEEPPMREPNSADAKAIHGEVSPEPLVDIRTVSVDKTLPREERIAEYVLQIKNPYRFRCGKFTVSASFAEAGPSLEDCLLGILRQS
jgi:hypothetical protein